MNPHLAERNGFQFSFKHDTGVVIPIEAGLVVGAESRGTLGTYKIGGYYDTSDSDDLLEDENGAPYVLTGDAPRRHHGRATFYAMADQTVAHFGGDPGRPLRPLAGVTYAPPDRSLLTHEWYAGVLAKGLIEARPSDVAGLIVVSGKVSPHLAQRQRLEQSLGGMIPVQQTETAIELNYDIAVAKWLHITPGAQWIVRPAADPIRHDVTVIDLKAVLRL